MTAISEFAADVRCSLQLTPRQLPSRYLYDALGSALFDAICELPWYGITRAEARLLAQHRDDVFRRLHGLRTLVELGPGNGNKLRTLVDSGANGAGGLTVHLVDVSATALATAARTVAEAGSVSVMTHEASFEAGLEVLPQHLAGSGRALCALLGSNIGNFDAAGATALLRRIRAALGAGDGFLIGADLVKAEHDLLRAYDDPLGVSAAFNLNLLVRINRELGGDFDVAAFTHRAIWNAARSRMEMYLVATRDQTVTIAQAGLELALSPGDSIWTETSYKYRPEEMVAVVEGAGFRALDAWIDPTDRFALMLFEAA